MGVPFVGAAIIVGGFVAEALGPTWWRLYWIGVAIWLLRGAAVSLIRLRLPRMAAGFVVAALVLGMLAFPATGMREAGDVVQKHLIWAVTLLAAMLLLFGLEYRWSPEKLRSLRRWVQGASVWDRLTFRHAPDLRVPRDRDA